MAFKKYTQCYNFGPGETPPYHISDIAELAFWFGAAPAVITGLVAGLASGAAIGGPIGAILGALIGVFVGLTAGTWNALSRAAEQWRFHRLVCLSGVQCAVGRVIRPEERGDLGQFDNDQFFDMFLMPYPPKEELRYTTPSENFKASPPQPGIVDPSMQAKLDAHPRNDVFIDEFQGQALMRPSVDLPYDTRRNWLHCEAEGDFWVRIGDLALALGLLAGALGAGTVAAAIGGASLGCSIGGFFGPIGCLIGAILGLIIGLIAAALASKEIFEGVLQDIFDTDPGDIEDANVGDEALGPLAVGDRLVVLGEHVYDGFHEGWHEIHPLMAVMRIPADSHLYVEWDPDFPPDGTVPDETDLAGIVPPEGLGFTPQDIQQGLESDRFRARAVALKDFWCQELRAAFDETVRATQQSLTERWTIHPLVDGCAPEDPVIK